MIWAGLLRGTASMRWTQPRFGSVQSESVVLGTCVLHLAPVSAPDGHTKPLLPMCAAWSTALPVAADGAAVRGGDLVGLADRRPGRREAAAARRAVAAGHQIGR